MLFARFLLFTSLFSLTLMTWPNNALAQNETAATPGHSHKTTKNPDKPAVPNHVHYKKSAEQDRPSPTGALAPRLQNLGKHTFPVTTKNKQAQLFMNQGLNLSYAFNHAEAARAFKEAARLDPNLAMAYWGQALVLGPNINAAMDPANEPIALDLVKKAVAMKAKASPREQAYIDALAGPDPQLVP